MTINSLIELYIEQEIVDTNKLFSNHEFQIQLVIFARSFNVFHTPDTFSRGWRKFREEQQRYIITEVEIPGKKEKYFRIKLR